MVLCSGFGVLRSRTSLRHRGRHVVIGSVGERRVSFDLLDFYHQELTLYGCRHGQVRSSGVRGHPRRTSRRVRDVGARTINAPHIPVVIRSARGVEFDREGGDHRESVPFSCRLVDATSGNKQQLEARSSNSQRSEAKAFRLRKATGGKSRQDAVTRPNAAVNRRVAGSNPA